MHDLRLIGIWRSDARRTSLDVAARRDLSAAKQKRLLGLFGKLELRYTSTHCYSTLNGQVTADRYRVVAKDSSSVAIVVSNALAGEQIAHLHFEGSHYWIVLGSGRMREFFKRVSPKRTPHPRNSQAPDKSPYQTKAVLGLQMSGKRVYRVLGSSADWLDVATRLMP